MPYSIGSLFDYVVFGQPLTDLKELTVLQASLKSVELSIGDDVKGYN